MLEEKTIKDKKLPMEKQVQETQRSKKKKYICEKSRKTQFLLKRTMINSLELALLNR